MDAPPGLKGLVVAETSIGSVRGAEGFYHYRHYDATSVAEHRSLEAAAHLLLEGELPTGGEETAFRSDLAALRSPTEQIAEICDTLAGSGQAPVAALQALLPLAIDPTPLLDLTERDRKSAVMGAIGLAPTLLARAYRVARDLPALMPDASLSHAADYVRMVTGTAPTEAHARAVERYLVLTADHGFNASTFTARVIASTGAPVGGVLAGALAALSGPLHGGAPSRVLDMLDAIGDPAETERYAASNLDAGGKIMGFGHAVYRADDPRSALLRQTAIELGGDLVDRAIEIERRMLDFLRSWKPQATIVTNVEYYAALVLHLAGIPQEMFTATFTVSRIIGWGAHVLEQAAENKIIRPSARYVGIDPPMPLPAT